MMASEVQLKNLNFHLLNPMKMVLSPSHHCLIGLPGSGKSTLSKYLQKIIPKVSLICPDTIRAQLYGDCRIQGDWTDIEAQALQQAKAALKHQYTIIYDATNAQRIWRLNWLEKVQQLTEFPQQWIGWWLDIPLQICLERNRHRDRQVPEDVIQQMAMALQVCQPTEEEGFIKIYRFTSIDQVPQ